ncbi:hypothetical protein MVES1_001524 [Malassezia vespertilionis]|uniref:uncharacterized protein n=1 Tax=Malassezia vespertilionis TaxID=2020962 RepID=UPI0024B04616|nr:uncharacterized protein MVES1_001524 [Malassezia vespertilionis]WFD06182.1 hypothetical protein MVES1_001524 [Malassezia vespertilionis]
MATPAVVPKKGLLPTPVPSSAVPLNVRNPKRSARPSDPSAIDLPPAKAQKGTRSHARSKNTGNHVCLGCQATSTPEWRKGPTGPRTLCNACGLLYAKMYRKREQDAVAAAIACNRDPTQAKKEIADALLQPDCREEQLESIRAGVRVVASMKQHRMGVNLIKTDVRAMPPMIKPTN